MCWDIISRVGNVNSFGGFRTVGDISTLKSFQHYGVIMWKYDKSGLEWHQ